ncbi:MAG: glycoside hydrolase family 31 protein [Treponema sp.]|nr:glycoside hydrolase family 31 protein [Treponema sp.]
MIQYRKIDTPENYNFDVVKGGSRKEGALRDSALKGGADAPVRLSLTAVNSGVFRLQGQSERWSGGSGSIAGLAWNGFPGEGPSGCVCTLDDAGSLDLSVNGTSLLKGRGFGLCGPKWLLRFEYDEETKFFGLGGKNLGFELSGKRTLFWNTDLFAEFDWAEIADSRADPLYASFPVLIGRKRPEPAGGVTMNMPEPATSAAASGTAALAPEAAAAPLWWAIVMDNPWPAFMNLGASEGIFNAGSTPFKKYLYLGARNGAPDIWIFAETDPKRLVQKIQTLQGRFALPPLWALGHHQCRWGYRSYADLKRIADEYEKRQIPNDGLWLDIDYMEGFRVFTVNKEHFTDPEQEIASLAARGYKVVPILDPGLRRDENFHQYKEAKERDILCKTPEGKDYIGFVWPGYTVFPDFSLEEGRQWWAEEVARFTKLGFAGYWIDMNDPATGSVPLDDMRFKRGTLPHDAFHNQYALGMAMATRQGLEKARPDERPFIITRSAYLGTAQYSGMWTGDNVSNKTHLAKSLPFSLNLSVSGMPFNGPDVPGFAGDADGSLMETWYKAGFLFPFFRNHNIAGAKDQEPWTRGKGTEKIVAEYIRSRYKLLPYIYQLWIAQEERGEPVLRPLWYHWPETDWTSSCDDAYTLGDSLLHAPLLDPAAKSRTVRLPAGQWFDWKGGRYLRGDQSFTVRCARNETPLYFRSGSVIPMLPGLRTTNEKDLRRVDLFLVMSNGDQGKYRYCADDGHSLSYRDGLRSELELSYEMKDGVLQLEAAVTNAAYGPINYRIMVPNTAGIAREGLRQVLLNGQVIPLVWEKLRLAGRENRVLASQVLLA